MLYAYKGFSILPGSGLSAAIWTIDAARSERTEQTRRDLIVLLALAIPGGMIAALFSVGIGGLVALYLFMRHYPLLLCTWAACVISAVSCLRRSVAYRRRHDPVGGGGAGCSGSGAGRVSGAADSAVAGGKTAEDDGGRLDSALGAVFAVVERQITDLLPIDAMQQIAHRTHVFRSRCESVAGRRAGELVAS